MKTTSKAKLIFLDFDGVLNDPEWLRCTSLLRSANFFEFDPLRLSVLALICGKTNAKLVLASSWNMRDGVKEYFENLRFEVVGRLGYYSNRGDAVKNWLSEHQEYKNADYIILDDDKSDYDKEQREHLVFTGTKTREWWTKNAFHLQIEHIGLNIQHVGVALGLLGVENEQFSSKD